MYQVHYIQNRRVIFTSPKAFFKLNHGVYIVSSSAGGKDGGCVINAMTQVTSLPARLSIAPNKNNYALKLIETSSTFSSVVLSEDVEMEQIKRSGFQPGKNAGKYDGIPQGRDSLSNPYPIEGVCVRFACRMIFTLDVGAHVIVIGEVVGAEVVDSAFLSLTYVNYYAKKNGTTPPNAPSCQENTERAAGYHYTVCGYILESNTLSDNFICPVCDKDASYFVKL